MAIKNYMTDEIEMYQVEMLDGRKVIHYNGFLWRGDEEVREDGEVLTWRIEEGTWCGLGGRGSEIAYVDSIEGSKFDFVMEQFEMVQQYGGTISDEEHDEYARSWCEDAEYLPMDDVTVDTPCGAYWF